MDTNKLLERIEELENKIVDLERETRRSGFLHQIAKKSNIITGVMLSVIITSVILYAAQITFTDGTIISASEVNNNFSELYKTAWGSSDSNIYFNTGNVGIGTNSPAYMLDVNGTLRINTINTNNTELLINSESGYFIIARQSFPSNTKFSVDMNGNVRADGSFTSPASDHADLLWADEKVEAGDVLVIDKNGKLVRCSQSYQMNVAGVYSTAPSFLGGVTNDSAKKNKIPLAIAGVVPVKVTAENGSIYAGDSLTTSSIPGHAMKAQPITVNGITFYPSGVIIGKTLGNLEKGEGTILVLVTLQ